MSSTSKQMTMHVPKRAANGMLEHPICSETARRLDAETRLARFVFAVTGESLTDEEIDVWIRKGADVRQEVLRGAGAP